MLSLMDCAGKNRVLGREETCCGGPRKVESAAFRQDCSGKRRRRRQRTTEKLAEGMAVPSWKRSCWRVLAYLAACPTDFVDASIDYRMKKLAPHIIERDKNKCCSECGLLLQPTEEKTLSKVFVEHVRNAHKPTPADSSKDLDRAKKLREGSSKISGKTSAAN
jgi:hypothetical protein